MVRITPFLRQVLLGDAVFALGGVILMLPAAPLLGPLTGLPAGLLMGAGLLLLPFAATVGLLARKADASARVLIGVIVIEALWAAASIGLLLLGSVTPNGLGIAFVVGQALVTAVFAQLLLMAIRRQAAAHPSTT
ncbi:MAG TPA: hypothetical protein VJR58_25090 [Vineibacter sp.]|nr:hypothetical protein [Vineibacter sp.]